jgi:hypothetical protein
MKTDRFPFLARALRARHAWLVWLALLLPVSQAAAVWHTFSHARGAPVAAVGWETGGKQAHHADATCNLCLAAASVLLDAPPLHFALAVPAGEGQAALAATASLRVATSQWRRQRARGPPLLLS